MASNTLALTIQQVDAAGYTTVRRAATFTDSAPSTGEFRSGNLIDTSEATLSLPVAQVRQVYIKNTDTAGTITVKWTPTTGSKVTILVLNPGDSIAFWTVTTGATVGISLLTLTASVANTTYDLYLGG